MFDKRFLSDEVFDKIRFNYVNHVINYIINSKYRKSVKLVDWLKNHDTSKLIPILEQIPTSSNYDEQVIHCLNWVVNNIEYRGDTSSWSMNEYWQTPTETINRLAGDCEDGAILLYHLCRLKGVPANRLLLMAGDVVGGGHCWLAYKPETLPINFVFLDWCYWVDTNSIDDRTIFYLDKKRIVGYSYHNYLEIWFAFSELGSYYEIAY